MDGRSFAPISTFTYFNVDEFEANPVGNNRHGAQGILNEASKSHLVNEFGTDNDEEVVKKILRNGSPQVGTVGHLSSNFCTH